MSDKGLGYSLLPRDFIQGYKAAALLITYVLINTAIMNHGNGILGKLFHVTT